MDSFKNGKKLGLIIFIGFILILQYFLFLRPTTGSGSPEPFLSSPTEADSSQDNISEKKSEIKMAFAHAWYNYVIEAWGKDEVKPVSGGGVDHLGLAWTIIDSLDTLWIMGFKEEFQRARDWIAKNFKYEEAGSFSVFETNIRVLGGFLSAYGLSEDKLFLEKAVELADKLILAFDTKSSFPHKTIDLSTNEHWGNPCLAEIGTLQLEFVYLSQISGNFTYAKKALKVFDMIDKMNFKDGLVPTSVDVDSGTISGHISIAGCGDSYFEYLLKTYLFTDDKKYLKMYLKSLKGWQSLVRYSKPNHLAYILEIDSAHEIHKFEHLGCFVGGLFSIVEESFQLGKEITYTCHQMYNKSKTGISSERILFNQDSDNDFVHQGSYILRPEAVESFFYLWRKTHDPIYREWGWQAFQAINKYCRTPRGFAGIEDVNQIPPRQIDRMETFFLAETLKYLYLLFEDDDAISLKEYVFNTEAHPFPISSKKYS